MHAASQEADLNPRGFTLIEALITTVILVSGLTAVASAFSYSSFSSLRIRQQTAALALVTMKMEALKADTRLIPGRYSESVEVAADGSVMTRSSANPTYLRTWEISPEVPSRITVIVLGKQPSRSRPYIELARATTAVSPRF